MTRARCLRALRSEEGGYTIVELLTVMGILGIVMGSLATLMVSATSANQRMGLDYQAQTEARLAVDRMRREGHAACSATPIGPANSITFTFPTAGALATPKETCPGAVVKKVSWCTVPNGASRYGLYRMVGATCNATGVRVADYLTVAAAFNYQTASQERPKMAINIAINPRPSKPNGTYTLDGHIVLRNSPRGA